MNLRQFAINNVLRNKRTYLAHFLSSAFSVMIFFIYALLLFHPELQGELKSTSDMISSLGTMGMKVAQIIIFIFSFFFLLYSVSAFLKLRKKEFGILMILGMSRKQFYRLLFVENMIIGCAAIIAGIVAGTFLSKFLLIISANILAIEKGLSFYFPIKAALITAGAFLLLFLLISLFTSRLVRTGTVLELVKAEEKPKPEPKTSPWLSLLAIVLLAAGYGMVLCFAILQIISLGLLLSGVGLTILGTYFLFTQFSVYSIRGLKKRSRFFFKKTNMVTISEFMYRMKDNAVMFFLVSVISASAFTGIGTCLALGNSGLSEMINPYAFSYTSFGEKADKQAIETIKEELTKANIPFAMGSFKPIYTTNDTTLIKLSNYNEMAKALGYPTETVSTNQAIFTPTTVKQKNDWRIHGQTTKQLEIVQEKMNVDVTIKKALPYIVFPEVGSTTIIVSDKMYEKFLEGDESNYRDYRFVVKNWQETKEVAQNITKKLNPDNYNFSSLVLNWLTSKQENGLLLILSGLVGVVFFTFAASFIYFRLYADLDRDIQQYRMISKIGLSKKELSQIVTRQLVLLFFLPIVMAIIHGSVAFFALQRLVDFSVLKSSIIIFVTFGAAQVVYFFIARWRYLKHLYTKMV
ncbi:FtsX-like permease family protein [Bacillus sporothermodurans]|uniref:FtsX-like permease family protein n=1 Tax=Heyndrickxia sporothermodurans TaxID=46224 RepID=UPI00192C7405|nr:FtsX-like permease family protein [Heyndrickxia sporothermodurans]MBL5795551.1 FtsX-like permease family protein [Heyndrickxia sporothermodurans]